MTTIGESQVRIRDDKMIYCDRCGHGNTPNSNFCSNCGFPLRKESEPRDDSKETALVQTRNSHARTESQKETQQGYRDINVPDYTCRAQNDRPEPPPPRGYIRYGYKGISGAPFSFNPDYQQYYQHPPVAPPRHQYDPMAIVSLVFSILSFYFLYVLGAIIGLIFGYVSLSNIRKSGGNFSGKELAITGIILGWVNIALFAIIIVSALILKIFQG